MCVIIYQPKEAHLFKDRAKRLWEQNPHGGGFTFVEEGEIVVKKYMRFNEFWRAFETTRSRLPKTEFLIHMRIATHGTVNLDNVHPFVVNKSTVMAHNGIFSNMPKDDEKSDTRVFIDQVLPELPDNWMDNPVLFSMMEGWIGYNKLAFMTADPDRKLSVYIFNVQAGVWVDKMWFSNTHKVKEPIVPVPTTWSNAVDFDDTIKDAWKIAANARRLAKLPSTQTVQEQLITKILHDKEPTLEQKVLEESVLIELRVDQGLSASIVMSIYTDNWLCFGCDEEINATTGECHCWLKVCLDCFDMAATCNCGNWSSNLRYYDELTTMEKSLFIDLFTGDKNDLPEDEKGPFLETGNDSIGVTNTNEILDSIETGDW